MNQFFKVNSLVFEKAYGFIFIYFCALLSFFLVIDLYPRKLFYVGSYIVLLYLSISLKKKWFIYDPQAMKVSVSFIIIGLVRFFWACSYPHSVYSDVVNNYYLSGKVLILSAPIAYFFIAWRSLLTTRAIKISFFILYIGLLITFFLALNEHINTSQRIKLSTDSAGTVSYLITILSLTTLFTGYRLLSHNKLRYLIFITVFILNFYMLILTESRAGIFSVLLLYSAFFIIKHQFPIKITVLFLLALTFLSALVLPDAVMNRIDSINKEIAAYHINNDTSIGARFSIWKGGFHSVNWAISGQSPDERTTKARNYINIHERGNPEAFNNIKYHLHDDFLETLSLQGISGAVSIIIFYSILFLIPLFNKAPHLAILPLSFIIFGLTDTLLIQATSVTVVCMSIALSFTLLPKECR